MKCGECKSGTTFWSPVLNMKENLPEDTYHCICPILKENSVRVVGSDCIDEEKYRKMIERTDPNFVYFELNDWFAGRDYPDAEPFLTWCGANENEYFANDEWVKKNGLCVVISIVDQSVNYCITAPRKWVEENCPKLLSDERTETVFEISGASGTHERTEEFAYARFLRFPDENGEVRGQFGCLFKPYRPENIGVWEDEEVYY